MVACLAVTTTLGQLFVIISTVHVVSLLWYRRFFSQNSSVMGRTKYRTKKAFIGRRKKASMMRVRKEVFGEETRQIGGGELAGRHPDVADQAEAVREDLVEKLISASARKIAYFQDEAKEENEENLDDCYAVVQESMLNQLLSNLLCSTCKNPGISFRFEERSGFAVKGSILCSHCETTKKEYLCQRIGKSKSVTEGFDINARAVLAFRGIGCGLSAIRQWCGIMNMPYTISQNMFTKNQQKVQEASKATFNEISEQSRKAITEAYSDLGIHADDRGILDIGVSFDGSWQKRGHTSHNGMASVIDLMTGLPIDFEVLSNYCNKCKIAEDKPADLEWKAQHSLVCQKNFSGSANAMEVECAKRLWSRSEEMHKLRYTTILCDGDSKACDAVNSMKVYGENVTIEKEDCVNHVSKRMGTALRKVADSMKAQNQSITGKGKLTKVKMTKIQNYYGRAIKDHSSDVELLQKRIMSILLHMSSTDKAPKHTHCPDGASSWCFWQRAMAKSETPGSHNEHETLPPEIGQKLVPIFRRLSDKDLLKRCARNKTQNPNESFHQIIWKICPKATYVGRKTIETAVALAACQFSMGATFNLVLCRMLRLEPGKHLEASSEERNKDRIRKAEKAASKEAKTRRKALKYKTIAKEHETKNAEGPTYAAGHFDY